MWPAGDTVFHWLCGNLPMNFKYAGEKIFSEDFHTGRPQFSFATGFYC
jgi:hypothetical protein